jgi:hypothetical protein
MEAMAIVEAAILEGRAEQVFMEAEDEEPPGSTQAHPRRHLGVLGDRVAEEVLVV